MANVFISTGDITIMMDGGAEVYVYERDAQGATMTAGEMASVLARHQRYMEEIDAQEAEDDNE